MFVSLCSLGWSLQPPEGCIYEMQRQTEVFIVNPLTYNCWFILLLLRENKSSLSPSVKQEVIFNRDDAGNFYESHSSINKTMSGLKVFPLSSRGSIHQPIYTYIKWWLQDEYIVEEWENDEPWLFMGNRLKEMSWIPSSQYFTFLD